MLAGAHTGYEFRFVRLKGPDEMPVYVFRQLKSPDEQELDFFQTRGGSRNSPAPLSRPTPARSSRRNGDALHRNKLGCLQQACTSTRPPRSVPDLGFQWFVALLT